MDRRLRSESVAVEAGVPCRDHTIDQQVSFNQRDVDGPHVGWILRGMYDLSIIEADADRFCCFQR